jgi:hypothetical protein
MFGANHAPILHRHKHCLQTDRNKIPPNPCHIVLPSDVSNTIFEPLVCSMQTVHLSCDKITTTSKRTELRFQLSLVTWEYHRVCPKWFLSQWDVWRKPCNYLASALTLSLDGPKWDSTWPTSPRSSIGWKMIQNSKGIDTKTSNSTQPMQPKTQQAQTKQC